MKQFMATDPEAISLTELAKLSGIDEDTLLRRFAGILASRLIGRSRLARSAPTAAALVACAKAIWTAQNELRRRR